MHPWVMEDTGKQSLHEHKSTASLLNSGDVALRQRPKKHKNRLQTGIFRMTGFLPRKEHENGQQCINWASIWPAGMAVGPAASLSLVCYSELRAWGLSVVLLAGKPSNLSH